MGIPLECHGENEFGIIDTENYSTLIAQTSAHY